MVKVKTMVPAKGPAGVKQQPIVKTLTVTALGMMAQAGGNHWQLSPAQWCTGRLTLALRSTLRRMPQRLGSPTIRAPGARYPMLLLVNHGCKGKLSAPRRPLLAPDTAHQPHHGQRVMSTTTFNHGTTTARHRWTGTGIIWPKFCPTTTDNRGTTTGQPRDNHGTTTTRHRWTGTGIIWPKFCPTTTDNRGTTTGQPRDNHGTTTTRHRWTGTGIIWPKFCPTTKASQLSPTLAASPRPLAPTHERNETIVRLGSHRSYPQPPTCSSVTPLRGVADFIAVDVLEAADVESLS